MNGKYSQQFIFPYFSSHQCKDTTLELQIFSFMGLVESQMLARSLNKRGMNISSRIAPYFFDDPNKKSRSVRGLQKYEVKYMEQIRALRDNLISRKKVDLHLSILLKIGFEDIYSKYMEMDLVVQVLNQINHLHHLVLDGTNVEDVSTITESLESLNMSTYQNSLKQLQFENFKFNDKQSSLMIKRIMQIQCYLRVIKFEKCSLNCDSIQVLINYLGSNLGGQSLIEIAFVAIEFDWKIKDEDNPFNQQQELAIALLKQPTLTSLTIKHTNAVRDLINEILMRSGDQIEPLPDVTQESEDEAEKNIENDELFDNLLDSKQNKEKDIATNDDDKEDEGEDDDTFESNFEQRMTILNRGGRAPGQSIMKTKSGPPKSVKIQEEVEVKIIEKVVPQKDITNNDELQFDKGRNQAMTINANDQQEQENWSDEDQFNFNNESMARIRSEAFTIKGNKNGKATQEVKQPIIEVKQQVHITSVTVQESKPIEDHSEGSGSEDPLNFLNGGRSRGEAISIKVVDNKDAKVTQKEEQTKPNQELIKDQKSDEEEEDGFGFMDRALMSRDRGQAFTIKEVKNKDDGTQEAPNTTMLEKESIIKTEQIVTQAIVEDYMEEPGFMPRSRGQAMTIKSNKKEELEQIQQAIEEEKLKQGSNFDEEEDGFGFMEEALMSRSRGQAFSIKEVKEIEDKVQEISQNETITNEVIVETKVVEQKSIQNEETIVDNNQFNNTGTRSRGQAMTIKAKNKEELEKIQQAIEEQRNDNIEEEEDGFAFLEQALNTETKSQAIISEDIAQNNNTLMNELIIQNIQQDQNAIQQEQKSLVESVLNENTNDTFNDDMFQPRSRGQAMTIKSKNKEELEKIQQAIEEQQNNHSEDEEDRFGFLEQTLNQQAKSENLQLKDTPQKDNDKLVNEQIKQSVQQDEQIQQLEQKSLVEIVINEDFNQKNPNEEEFNDDMFQPRSRGQAMTIKGKNKEDLEKIQQAIEEQNNANQEEEDGFGFLDQALSSQNKIENIVDKDLLQNNDKQIQEVIIQVQQQEAKSLVDVVINENLNKDDSNEFNDDMFQPRSRGQAMTIKGKNKEEFAEIQKGIQEQQNIEDNNDFGFFDEALLGKTRQEAVSIKAKDAQIETKIEDKNIELTESIKPPITQIQNDTPQVVLGAALIINKEVEIDIKTKDQNSVSTNKIVESAPKVTKPMERSRRTIMNQKKVATKVVVEQQEDIQVQKDEVKVINNNDPAKVNIQPKSIMVDKSDKDVQDGFEFDFDSMPKTRSEAMTMGKGKKVSFNVNMDVREIIIEENDEFSANNNMFDAINKNQEENKVQTASTSPTKGLERSRRTLITNRRPTAKVKKDTKAQSEESIDNEVKPQDELINQDEANEDEDRFDFNFNEMTRSRGEAMSIKQTNKIEITEVITQEQQDNIKNESLNQNQPIVDESVKVVSIEDPKLQRLPPTKTPAVRQRRTINLAKKCETKDDNVTANDQSITVDPKSKVMIKKDLDINTNKSLDIKAPIGSTPSFLSKPTLLMGADNKGSTGINFDEIMKPKGETMTPKAQIQARPLLGINKPIEKVVIEKETVTVIDQTKADEAKQNDAATSNNVKLERSRRTIVPVKKPVTKVVQETKIEQENKEGAESQDQKINVNEDEFGFNFEQMSRSRGAAMTIKAKNATDDNKQEVVVQQQIQKDEAIKITDQVTETITTKPNEETKSEAKPTTLIRSERSRRTVLPVKKPVTKTVQEVKIDQEIKEINQSPEQKIKANEEEEEFALNFDQMARTRGAAMTIKAKNITEENQQTQPIIQQQEVVKVTETIITKTSEETKSESKPTTLIRSDRARRTAMPIKKPATKVVVEQTNSEQSTVIVEQDQKVIINQAELNKQEDIKKLEVTEESLKVTELVNKIEDKIVQNQSTTKPEEVKQVKPTTLIRSDRSRRTAMPIKKPATKVTVEVKEEQQVVNNEGTTEQTVIQKQDQEEEDGFQFNFDNMTRARGEAMTMARMKTKPEDQIVVQTELDNIIETKFEDDMESKFEAFNPSAMYEDDDIDDTQFDQYDQFDNESRMTRSRGEAMSMSRQKLNKELEGVQRKESIQSILSQTIDKSQINQAIQEQQIKEVKQEEQIIQETIIQESSQVIEQFNPAQFNNEDEEEEDQFGQFNEDSRMTRSRGQAMTMKRTKLEDEIVKPDNQDDLLKQIEITKSIQQELMMHNDDDMNQFDDNMLSQQRSASKSIMKAKEQTEIIKETIAHRDAIKLNEEDVEQMLQQQVQLDEKEIIQENIIESLVQQQVSVKQEEFNPASMYEDEEENEDEDDDDFNMFAATSMNHRMTRARGEAMTISKSKDKQDMLKEINEGISKIKENDQYKVIIEQQIEIQAEQKIKVQEPIKERVEIFNPASMYSDDEEEDQFVESRMSRTRGEAMSIKVNKEVIVESKLTQDFKRVLNDNIANEIFNADTVEIINEQDSDIDQEEVKVVPNKVIIEKPVEEFNPASMYEDDNEDEEEDQFDMFAQASMNPRMTRTRGEAMTISKSKDNGQTLKEINQAIENIKQKESLKKEVVEQFNPASMYPDDDEEEEDQFAQFNSDEPRSRGAAMTIKRTINKGEAVRPTNEEMEQFKPFQDEEDEEEEDQFDMFARASMNPRMTRSRAQGMTLKQNVQEDAKDDGPMNARSGGGPPLNNKDKVKIINEMLNPAGDTKGTIDNQTKVNIINEMLDPRGDQFGFSSRQRGQAMTLKKKQKDEQVTDFVQKQGRQRGAATTMRSKKKVATIKQLQLVSLELEDSDMLYFKDGFEKIQGLESLELYGNQISNEGVKVLGQALKNENMMTLKYLGLRNNLINDTGFYEFLYNVAESPYQRLEHLSACSNQIELEFNCKQLTEILKKGYLKQLDLVGSPSMQLEGLLSLDHTFQNSSYPSNDAFNLLFTDEVTLEETKFLSKFMKQDKNLNKIVVYDYLMEEEAAISFYTQIFQHSAITMKLINLSIFFNNLEDADVALLTQKLDQQFPALKILDLRGNAITDSGANLISEALSESYSKQDRRKWIGLHTLNLTSNPIGYEGLYNMISALKNNTKGWGLRKLKMSDNDIDAVITQDFADNLIQNTTLQTLLLGYNGLQGGSGPAFEQIISNNTTLSHLDIEFNEFNSEDGKCIINGLNNRTKKNLRKLNLEGNKFSEDNNVIRQLEIIRNREIRVKVKM